MKYLSATFILFVLIGCATQQQQQNPLVGSWRAPDGSLLTFGDDYTATIVNAKREVSKTTYAFIDDKTVTFNPTVISDLRKTFTFSINEPVLKTKDQDGSESYWIRAKQPPVAKAEVKSGN